MAEKKQWLPAAEAIDLADSPDETAKLAGDPFTKTFGVHQAGDCRIEDGAVFTLYPDGSTRWDCMISSGDTGDTAEVRFRCEDSAGTPLFHTNYWHHDIGQKDQKQHWTDSNGPNAEFAGFYSRVSNAVLLGS